MKKRVQKILALLVSLTLLAGLLPAALAADEAEAASFPDVAGHWSADAVNRWAGAGIFNGDEAGNFLPDKEMTRAEFAQTLVNLMGYAKKAGNVFADVSDNAWYADAVLKLCAAGVLQGSGGSAMPEDPITREQAAVMLCRAFAVKPGEHADIPFDDRSDVSSWAADAVAALSERGMVNGVDGSSFAPGRNIDRASVATLLDNMIAVYADQDGGTVTGTQKGIVIVAADGVTLESAALTENLIVAPAAAGATVTLAAGTTAGNVLVSADGATVVVETGAAIAGMEIAADNVLTRGPGTITSLTVTDGAGVAVAAETAVATVTNNGSSAVTVGSATVAAGGVWTKSGTTSSSRSSGSSSSSGSTTAATPTLSVKSDIFGSGDNGGKTTIKNILVTAEGPGDQRIAYSDLDSGERMYYDAYNADGTLHTETPEGVVYTGSAVLTLTAEEGETIDDSKIDSSAAVVSLAAGDGYYADELVLSDAAKTLTGTWQNGELTYTLDKGALEWYIGDYQYIDNNSGREWSFLGGDGNGCYTFRFQVSGIKYDGKEVEPATFPVKVYIWGRSGTDLAKGEADLTITPADHLTGEGGGSGAAQGSDVQWTWKGDQGDFLGGTAKPVLCDNLQDDFFITWPAGSDASRLTADDVSITLDTQYGERYSLKSGGDHPQYTVYTSEGETLVAVTFHHAAFTPVFTTMTIAVDDGAGLAASQTYDIASVYAFMLQQGGGGLTADGVCTAYSYYGYDGLSVSNAVQASYTLKYTDENGVAWYYNGTGLSQGVEKTTQGFLGPITSIAAPDDAARYSAMGTGDCDVRFIVNTLFVKTRLGQTEVKTVNGENIIFEKEYTTGQIGNWDGVTLAPGYVHTSGFSPNQQWAWSTYYGSGWAPELGVIPTDFPYTDGPFGSYASQYSPTSGIGGIGGGPGGASGGPSGEYTCAKNGATYTLTLTPGSGPAPANRFTLKYGDGETDQVEGAYTTQSTTKFVPGTGLVSSTSVLLDSEGAQALVTAGVLDAWYSYLTPVDGSDGSKTFTITKDVSMALIPYDPDTYTIRTAANDSSPTGYTTTITVADDGYENVYAFGDWVAVKTTEDTDETGNQKTYGPGEWENGMEYASASALPLTKGDKTYTLEVDLASSVMGVIAYHDIANASDLDNVKPAKASFFVPYDSEKQSLSTDWTPAFPASEGSAGRIYATTLTTDAVYDEARQSATEGLSLSLSVYTPAGYDPGDTAATYPVVYLIPGGGSTYLSWFQLGQGGVVGNIFDNLAAAGKTQKAILVSMERADVNGDSGNCLPDIVQWVESHYNVKSGAENRALVGVSMGSVAATQIWLDDPAQFGYYGFLSGADKATFGGASGESADFGTLDAEKQTQMRAATYFLGGGTTDFNLYAGDQSSASITDLDAWMTHYEIPHNNMTGGDGNYDVTVGDHNWPIWIKLMIPFASNYLWN